MGYFERPAAPPAIPIPGDPRLWDDGCGRLTLAWRRPLGRHEGYALLRGERPDALREVARVAPSTACWPVPPEGGPWLAVACLRDGARGEPTAPVSLGGGPPPVPEPTPDLAAHPHGAPPQAPGPQPCCACCPTPRPLAPDDGALACPATGELYAALPTGGLARAAELPFGLCRCCEARQPLIRSGDAIVCLGRPAQRYTLDAGRYIPAAGHEPHAPLADADAIDAALRANSALLGLNGVFVAGHGRAP